MPRGATDSRQAILSAAAAQFAAHGFAGAGVDRIAWHARVNKAMIYYHFRNKEHLYHEIVRDMFAAISARTGAVASSCLAPGEKLDGFIEAIVAEARVRPHLPPMMMREVAEGGRHLNPDILRVILGVFANLRRILDEGARARIFKRVDPVLMYFTLVGPIVMYLAGSPVRRAIGRLRMPIVARTDAFTIRPHLTAFGNVTALGDHLKTAAKRALQRGPVRRQARKAPGHSPASRRHAAGRSGDQA